MVGVGEFEQFDRRTILDDKRDADADGLLGGIRISRPQSSEARSDTSNATCGTCRTRSGTAASASKRIHSTPNSLFSWLTTKTFRCFKWVSPGFASLVGIPTWW